MASILDKLTQKEKINQKNNTHYNENISSTLSKQKQISNLYSNNHSFSQYQEINEDDPINKNHQKQQMYESFQAKQIDIKRVQSKLMEDNEDHRQCLNMMIAYNEELALAQEKGEILKNGIWKAHFFKTLQYLLTDLNSTYNRNIQTSQVKQVSEWAKEQLLKLNSGNTQIRSFEGDRAFMLKTLMGFSRDFSKYQQKSKSREYTSKSTEKMVKTVSFMSANSTNIFTSNNESNLEESTTRDRMLMDQTFSAGGSKDQTLLISDPFIYSRDQTILTSTPFLTSKEFLESPRKGDQNKSTNEKISLIFTQDDESNNGQMPSCQIEEEQREYKLSARTKHCHYEPPQERLKMLKRRILSCDQNSSNQILSEDQRKQDQLYIRKSQTTQKVIEKQSKVDLGLTQSIKVSKQLKNGEMSKQASLDLESTESEESEIKRKCISFQRKCFQNDGILDSQRQLPLLDKRNKSQSTYFAYQPSEDPREIRMENKWIEARQIKLREKRENEEMIEVMKQWATAKGRIDKEISRKIDSSLYSSRYKECEHKHQKIGEQQKKSKTSKGEQLIIPSEHECSSRRNKTLSEHFDQNSTNKGLLKVVDMRNIIPSIANKKSEQLSKTFQKQDSKHLNLSKIEMLKLFHGNLINLKPTKNIKQPPDSDCKKELSLSIYSRIQEAQKAKSFSSILESAKHAFTLSSQLAEVNRVKDKLSKKKIRVSYKSLQTSLTFEEEPNDNNFKKEMPAPGQGLFSNPFSAIGLKKRRKNKK